MRKAISLLLALSMVLALCACGSSASENTLEKQDNFTVEGSTESESTSAKQDDFTVEDFEIEKYAFERMYFKVKVRNNTDTDAADFSMDYQLLDENGDSVYDSGFISHNIFAGQACWLGSYGIEDEDYKNAVTIRFVSYYTDKSKKDVLFNQKAEFSLVDNAGTSSSNTDENKEIVFNEPVFLYDDEKVKLVLNKVFEEDENGSEIPDKCVEINVENKSEYPVFVFGITFYIDDQETYTLNGPQGQNTIYGGKSADRNFTIRADADTPLASLEELYVADGVMSIEVMNAEGKMIIEHLHIPFSYDITEQVA